MDIKNVPAIIWCDSIDIKNIESNNYLNQPDTWESFSAFFMIGYRKKEWLHMFILVVMKEKFGRI